MKRMVTVWTAIFLLFASACAGGPSATKIEADTAYTNAFLGLTLTVPGGWWIYGMNQDNLSDMPDSTAEEGALNIKNGFMELANIGSTGDPGDNKNIEIDIFAEKPEGPALDMESYLELNRSIIESDEAGYLPYRLVSMTEENLGGTDYSVMRFYGAADNGQSAYTEVYVTQKSGYYIVSHFIYWESNAAAPEAVRQYISNHIRFDALP